MKVRKWYANGMATTANIILDLRRKLEDGTYPFKICLFNKRQGYISLNEYSSPKHWNNGLKKSHPEYKRLSVFLKRREADLIEEVEYCNKHNLDLTKAIEVIKNGIADNPELEIFLLKQKIAELQKQKGIGIIEFYKIRIEEIKKRGDSLIAYANTMKEFENYLLSDINLNQIDYEFLNGFINYKYASGTNMPGVMFYLRNLRALYKEAQKRPSLAIKHDNPFLGVIKVTKNRSEIILPTSEQLKNLFNFMPNKGTTKTGAFKMQRNVDIFKFQILIGGHDYVDVSLLTWNDIKNGRVRLYRFKNRKKSQVLVDNILTEEAKIIIEKYGNKESERIFDFIPNRLENEKNYINYRNNVTRSLKKAGSIIGFNGMRTKLPRFIFRSASGSLLIQKNVIEQIQGHKSKEETFTYQQRLPYNVIDKEHLKVLDLVF